MLNCSSISLNQSIFASTFLRFISNCFQYSIPNFSKLHPVIPRKYVPEWKNDMSNRELIVKVRPNDKSK